MRLIQVLILLTSLTASLHSSAVIVVNDLVPDVVVDISGAGGQYIIPNPFGGPEITMSFSGGSLSMVSDNVNTSVLAIGGTLDIDYQICGQILEQTSNWELEAFDNSPESGIYIAGFILHSPGQENYGWVNFSLDLVNEQMVIFQHAYQNSAFLPIEICLAADIVFEEICGNGVDDDGDGLIDFDDDECACTIENSVFGTFDILESGDYCTEDWGISSSSGFVVDSYSWFYNGVLITDQNTDALSINDPGEYIAFAQGQTGCASDTITLTDTELNSSIDFTIGQIDCNTEATEVDAVISGEAPLSLEWRSIEGVIDGDPFDLNISVSASGTYVLTLTSGICEVSDSVSVLFATEEAPIALLSYFENADCGQTEIQFNDESISSTEILEYLWTINNVAVSDSASAVQIISTDSALEVELNVTDAQGCMSTFTDVIEITVRENPIAQFSTTQSEDGYNLSFTDMSIGDVICWHWDFAQERTSEIQHPITFFGNNGPFEVILTVTDTLGCMDSTLKVINVLDPLNYFVPNAFTPDGDGFNDSWSWSMVGAQALELLVFDRDGHLVYETDDLDGFWNGSVNGGSYYANDGLYPYLFKVTGKQGDTKLISGSVLLIR
jgi:gliding motility-associated-like protein